MPRPEEEIRLEWRRHLVECSECEGGRFFCVVAQKLSKEFFEAKRDARFREWVSDPGSNDG